MSHATKARHESPSEFLPLGFPTGMDLVVYTEEEFGHLAEDLPERHRCITGGEEV